MGVRVCCVTSHFKAELMVIYFDFWTLLPTAATVGWMVLLFSGGHHPKHVEEMWHTLLCVPFAAWAIYLLLWVWLT